MILCLAVLVEHRLVIDRQRHRLTDRAVKAVAQETKICDKPTNVVAAYMDSHVWSFLSFIELLSVGLNGLVLHGVEIWPFPLFFLLALTTSCTSHRPMSRDSNSRCQKCTRKKTGVHRQPAAD